MGKNFKRFLYNESIMGGVLYKEGFGKMCRNCKFAARIEGDDTDQAEDFCDHPIFTDMPNRLSDTLTGWLFAMSEKNKCPVFKRGKNNIK
jgi:hypothetical protein